MKNNTTYKRIVSLVPSLTELLINLGLENKLVGITKFCVHPANLRKNKTIVGGTKNINLDKIKALNPDFILCNKEENTKEIVKNCQEICTVHVSDIFTIDDTLDVIHQYGKLFSCSVKAEELISEINQKRTDFREFIGRKTTLKVAYFIWKNPWMVAGNNNFINHLIELNKFENIFSNKERYPEVDIEKLKKEKADLIFLSSEPYPFQEKHILELKKISPKTNIILVDGEMFSWYGSRLLKAFDYFKFLNARIR